MDFAEVFVRERSRYEDGVLAPRSGAARPHGKRCIRAGLALLMLGRRNEALAWFDRAAERWRESWSHAEPESWGRPIGAIKAAVIAGRGAAEGYSHWTLELGSAGTGSPIGRYAATLALLVLGRWAEAGQLAGTLRGRDDFPSTVADALMAIGAGDATGAGLAIEAVLESFESRDDYLEGVPVADTVLVLLALASRRGLTVESRGSALLPDE